MNYINGSNEGLEVLNINTNIDNSVVSTESIAWTVKQDGFDSDAFAFVSPSENFNMLEFKYFQRLVCDFTSEGIALDNEVHYNLEGVSNGKVVYKGKFFTTTEDITNYSVNSNKYTLKDSTNNYTILD